MSVEICTSIVEIFLVREKAASSSSSFGTTLFTSPSLSAFVTSNSLHVWISSNRCGGGKPLLKETTVILEAKFGYERYSANSLLKLMLLDLVQLFPHNPPFQHSIWIFRWRFTYSFNVFLVLMIVASHARNEYERSLWRGEGLPPCIVSH